MARPNQSEERRREYLPLIARAFGERGYRRTTTAELARRCGAQENTLFRLWPDKKSMFLAAIEYVFKVSEESWERALSASDSDESRASRILEFEADQVLGIGRRRIVFASLSETDDPEIREALARMFEQFHSFVSAQIRTHDPGHAIEADLLAWAFIGLSTVRNIGRDLGLIGPARQKELVRRVGELLLSG